MSVDFRNISRAIVYFHEEAGRKGGVKWGAIDDGSAVKS